MNNLVLIDGNSLLNRAFYATPMFTTSSGQPTNAIFGFTKLLLKILSDKKPDYIIVAFDLKAPTFRHKIYDEYKATRKGMPDELAIQVEPLKSLLSEMKVAMCSLEGYEADDIIGTLSAKYDVHSYIYTGDRDTYQLVDDKTDVCFTKRGVSDILNLNRSNFSEFTDLDNPLQVVDLKSLMGDKSDNIPGVAGIGEKTAYELIKKYGSLDSIYENIDEIKGALKDKLIAGKEIAYLSYKLAKIDRSCPLLLDINDCKVPDKFSNEVKRLFEEFEFKSLIREDLFEQSVVEVVKSATVYPDKISVSNPDEIIPRIKVCKSFAAALEVNKLNLFFDNKEYELELHTDLLSNGLSAEEYTEILDLVFGCDENSVIMFDSKSSMHILSSMGIQCRCKYDDLCIAEYLSSGSKPAATLNELCESNILDISFPAFVTQKLFNEYIEKIKSIDCFDLYNDIELPLVNVLFSMETNGVKVSRDELSALGKQYFETVSNLQKEIYNECGQEFNINSPTQLGDVLFNKLELKSGKKGKNGKYSTNAEVLEGLVDVHPVAGKILKYRFYQKMLSTYIDGLRPYIDKDNLIHTTYNQTITATGRLSSANPNLQNIPIREEEGRDLRKVFVPRKGNIFIDADYSQIELRLLAHFSGCKELIQAYNEGRDIHALTASQVFGVPIDDVTPKMRREAKAVNFGIIYGISEFGLSRNLKIPYATSKEYIEKYFKTYSDVKNYMNSNVEFAREHGYISTLTGRRRAIPEIKSSNINMRQFGERAAMNMPLQGSSADIIKIAMIRVQNRLKSEGLKTKLILQVHDELVLDAPLEEKDRAAEILKYEMENAVKLSVPLTVDVHSGINWYDAK